MGSILCQPIGCNEFVFVRPFDGREPHVLVEGERLGLDDPRLPAEAVDRLAEEERIRNA